MADLLTKDEVAAALKDVSDTRAGVSWHRLGMHITAQAEQFGRVHTAVGVREGESLEAAVLRLVEDARPEGRWEKRARQMHAWLVAHVPVRPGSRWCFPDGRELIAEETVPPAPYAFQRAEGTGRFITEDHPATLGMVQVVDEEDLGQPVAARAYRDALTREKDEDALLCAFYSEAGVAPLKVRLGRLLDWVLRGLRPPESVMPMVVRALAAREEVGKVRMSGGQVVSVYAEDEPMRTSGDDVPPKE